MQNQDSIKKLENPLWHIHQKKIPSTTYPIDFTNLLNLVTALNTTNNKTIKDFVRIYLQEKLSVQDEQELDKIILLAIKYYKKFILPHIKKRIPDIEEKKAIEKLLQEIKKVDGEISS